MAWFETWFKNDLAKPINVVQLQGVLFNLDNLANKIGVELEYNGQPAALEGTIAGYVIRNDGTTLNLTTNTGKDGNKAWVILPQEAYTVEGPISIVIKLVYNSAETTIGACAGYVTRSRTSSEIAPTGTVIPSLASLEAAIAAANAAAVNAADATDYIAPTEEDRTASAAHAVGSYFINNGKLMKATSAIAQGATIVPYASGVTNYNCVEVPDGLSGDVFNVTNTANAAANNAADAQQLVAPVESFAGMPTGPATKAHATGSYFVYGGALYEATSDIAIGDPIVTTGTGANAAQVPGGAMGEVADLKSALEGFETTFTASSVGTKKFDANIMSGGTYTYTNNTNASTSVNVYKSDGTSKVIYGGLLPGKSVTFIADDDYAKIGGYFNAAGTVTFSFTGVFTDLNDCASNINYLESYVQETVIGKSETVTASSPKTVYIDSAIEKGAVCRYTNNTSSAITCKVIKSDETEITISQSILSGRTILFVANNDYVKIGGYFQAAGTATFEILGTSQLVYQDAIRKNQEYGIIQKVSNVGNISSMTIIGNKLFVFPYVSANADSVGKIFSIDEEGLLHIDVDTFTSNIGHQNTVDYSAGNKCLICSRYTENESDPVIDFSVYILQNIDESTRQFDIGSNTAIKYDMSQIEGIGNSGLNAIWGEENDKKYDIAYIFSKDSETQQQYWTKVQFGRGANNLGLGEYISGKAANQFNGSFRVVKTYELTTIQGIYEAINDACYHNGKIYRCPVQSMRGWAYIEEMFEMYDTTITDKRNLIQISSSAGLVVEQETEGIAISNGYLYIGSYANGIAVFKLT